MTNCFYLHLEVVGKAMDEKLAQMGANRIYDLGLGDDGECIEDDFDNWMEQFLQAVYYSNDESSAKEQDKQL